MNKKLKLLKSLFASIITLLLVFMGVAYGDSDSVNAQANSIEYEIYPHPQNIDYLEDHFNIPDNVSLTIGDNIDDATVDHVNATLTKNNIQVTQEAEFIVDLSVYSENNDKINHLPNVDTSIFEKFDSYILSIEENKVTLVGKDTDAVFHGVTTLDQLFAQQEDRMRSVVINDYADIEYRGFIEGFYGIPWSEENRISLMEFGQENKMNSYIFAPKDDVYHQSEWRKIITKEDLDNTFKPLVEAGTRTKNRFIFAIHPFMTDQIGIPTTAEKEAGMTADEKLAEDIEIIIEKFEQVYDIGVRQYALLADDAISPLETQIEVINALDDWIKSKDDVYSLIFTPEQYSGGPYPDIYGPLNDQTSDDVVIMYTGSEIIGSVDEENFNNFYDSFITEQSPQGREPYLWFNWPVNDYTDSTLFLGKAEMLQKGTDNFTGLVTNPMQEAQLSKIGLFQVADYTWNVHDFDVDQSWEASFERVDSDVSEELHTVSKHMSYPRDGVFHQAGLKWGESEELAERIQTLESRLEKGEPVGDLGTEMIDEFQKIIDAGNTVIETTKNETLKNELDPYVEALNATLNANIHIIKSTQALENEEYNEAVDFYSLALDFIAKSRKVTKAGFKPQGHVRLEVKPGTKYLRPFARKMIEPLKEKIETAELPAELLIDFYLDHLEPLANPKDYTASSLDNYKEKLFNLFFNRLKDVTTEEARTLVNAVDNAYEALEKINYHISLEHIESLDAPAQPGEELEKAFDGNKSTIWHTPWGGHHVGEPATIVLKEPMAITEFEYVPRPSGRNGIIKAATLEIIDENEEIHTFKISDWMSTNAAKTIEFDKIIQAKRIVLTPTETYGDQPNKFAAASELNFKLAEVGDIPETIDYAEINNALDSISAVKDLETKNPFLLQVLTIAPELEKYDLLTSERAAEIIAEVNALLEEENSEETEEEAKRAAVLVERMVYRLPNVRVLTVEDAELVVAARAAYDGLSDQAKAHVTTLGNLELRENRLAALSGENGEVEDKFAVRELQRRIYRLPSARVLTIEDGAQVAGIRADYEDLNDLSKAIFSPQYLKNLELRETKLEELEKDSGQGN